MLIRVPDSWPHVLVAVLAMVVLGVIDLAGAFAAKEAVMRRSLPMAALGVGLFVMLFWVYASSLRYAELAPVTLGWVVLLQVGVVLLDRFHYGTPVSNGQWAAVVVLLAAQTYLLLAPAASAAGRLDPTASATTSTADVSTVSLPAAMRRGLDARDLAPTDVASPDLASPGLASADLASAEHSGPTASPGPDMVPLDLVQLTAGR